MQLETREETRALLLGGTPFPEPVLMWWNFVGRTRDEISIAYRDWTGDTGDTGDTRRHRPVRSGGVTTGPHRGWATAVDQSLSG